MQNKWTIYAFLGVMVAALITLAILQYHWLGSVSDAEKKRLEENLEASSENFVSDLNRDFMLLKESFKIQISKRETDVNAMLEKSLSNWNLSSEYPELIDSIYYMKDVYAELPQIELFTTNPSQLISIETTPAIKNWMKKRKVSGTEKGIELSLLRSPDFGNPTFIAVPVQLLDLVTIQNQNSGRNVQVSLNIDQSDDLVLLQLNNQVIKEQIIPNIAQTYFSDSYGDQYHISILEEDKKTASKNVYFTTATEDQIPEPDFKKNLRNLDFSSFLVFKSSGGLERGNTVFDNLDTLSSQIQSIEVNAGNSKGKHALAMQSSQWSYESETQDSILTVIKDTTINTSFIGNLNEAGWQFWLSFKEGSLDSFVNKAKNRNLAISFGILLILGFCVGMIVLFSNRSRELAEKQMLFVAGVSHELRTPLTVIRSAAENLNEGIVQNEERKKEYAQLMLREGRRLSDMVDQIMEFSGIQSGKKIYQFAHFNVRDFIEEVNEECKPHLEEKGMSLEWSVTVVEDEIYADKEALFLAVNNLIKNAIKFSDAEKVISLKVLDTELNNDNAIQFQVIDYGMGIPEEEHQQVFEPFYRGKKSVEDQIKGNGIGLSLVKKVVLAHNGIVTLKSKLGEGSAFSMIIPIGKENNHA